METKSAFLWMGGHPCLDFVNTEAMRQGHRTDLIPDGSALLTWMYEAHLLESEERQVLLMEWEQFPMRQEEVLQDFRDFRAVVRGMADDIVAATGVSDGTLHHINTYLERRSGNYQLLRAPDGTFIEQFVEQRNEDTPYLLGRIAGTVSDFLSHADLSLVRHCENPQCILYFYDTTKNHKRRWCSMSGCGNRAKAAAHYQRKKSPL